MKTVLLTGATGFLGSHLLESLLKSKYHLVILKRSTSDTWRIKHLLEKVKSYDIDCESLENAFVDQRIDAIIHTACSYGRNNESIYDIVDSNLIFGLKLLDACIKHTVTTFCNTDTLLNRTLNDYALSKSQFTQWLKQKNNKVQVINLKIEHMYGPKDDADKFVSWLLSQLIQGVAEIKLTSGEQQRDFIYIDDVVSAYMLVLEKAEMLPAFNEFEVGTGRSVSVKSFIQLLMKVFEDRFGESLTELNFGAVAYREGEVMEFCVDNSALMKIGWQPTVDLEAGLNATIQG